MKSVFFTTFMTAVCLFGLSFAQADNSDLEQAGPVKVCIYRVTKTFKMTATSELSTLQFRYPLIRRDFPNQKMYELATDPKYNALISDPDHNEIAIFYFSNIPSGKTSTVWMSYNIKIEAKDTAIDPAVVSNDYSGVASEVNRYLGNEGGVDVNNEFVRETALAIVKEIPNPYLKGKAIYDFITTNITYENIEDISGAQSPNETLSIRKVNCNAITKLFIALARACGLPAREVIGVVFTPDASGKRCVTDAGHAWVEICLPEYGWLTVDPTFGIADKDNYYCFANTTHIREVYGQLISRNPGSLYRGSSVEVRTRSHASRVPLNKEAQIEIELLSKY